MGWVGWVFSSLATWLPGCLVSGGRKAVSEMFPVQAQRSFLKSVVKDWTLFEREVGDVFKVRALRRQRRRLPCTGRSVLGEWRFF